MQLNFVLGTAAELIKVYPVMREATRRGHEIRVVSTGQSRENFLMQYRDFKLDEQALTRLIESAGDLGSARAALRWFVRGLFSSKAQFKAKLLIGSKTYVLVHGDTLSTLLGAILARRAGLPVVHIEAGLRSPSLLNPFPEEITRRLVSRIASVHMAPDDRAVQNLKSAGARGLVLSTLGNTLSDTIDPLSPAASAEAEPFALVNIHRFENLNSASRWSFIVDTLHIVTTPGAGTTVTATKWRS